MGLFDYDEERIKGLYHRAWLEANRGYVDTRKYDYLDKACLCLLKKITVAMMKHLFLPRQVRRQVD